VLLPVGVDANDQNLLQRGALLYCVGIAPDMSAYRKLALGPI
jgi:hypothetical protein